MKDEKQTLADLRQQYSQTTLDRDDLHADPVTQFQQWFQEARDAEILEPNAMTLATADANGAPSSRTVLLKGLDEHGFHFYTNFTSRKGRELGENPFASIVFLWKEIERQICIRGTVSRLPTPITETYFKSRPHGSQIGAWVSRQSSVIEDRGVLEQRQKELEERFSEGNVPLPDFWGGFALQPTALEFWQGRPNRLHDRFSYLQEAGEWKIHRLSP